jgi:antitoxin component YwqK of YwqJK toxin-antitoxin module
MFYAIYRSNELFKRTFVPLLATLLIFLTGCTINPCFDDASLYGEVNKELICYQEKKVKHGPHTQWYPKSEVKKFERTYYNDILDGSYREWYSNGQLKTEANYSDGKLHGMYTKYYSNGQKRVVGRYGNNVKTGAYKEFFKNGKPKLDYTFNPIGLHEGKQTRYRITGVPLSEYTYYQGKLVGKRFWRLDGSQESVLSHRK